MKNYFFSDMNVMMRRSMRHITHSINTIIAVCLTPIVMVLLFVYVLGGAIQAGTNNYVNCLLSGILLMAITSDIAYTTFRLFTDMQSGIFERFHSMPIARSSALWGHVLTSLVSSAISVVVITLVALIMGFRSSTGVLSWLTITGILVLVILTLIWIAVIPGLTAESMDGTNAFSYPLTFLPFISSAFVPAESMPGPIRAFAKHQPVTSIVSAIRALLSDQPVGNNIWSALVWCLGILVVAYVLAMLVYKRKTA